MFYTSIMIDGLRERLMAEGEIIVTVRVRPHAKMTQLKSVMGDGSLKIDLAAVAEDNKANIALIGLLAELFQVPSAQIEILSGKTARMKLCRISSSVS